MSKLKAVGKQIAVIEKALSDIDHGKTAAFKARRVVEAKQNALSTKERKAIEVIEKAIAKERKPLDAAYAKSMKAEGKNREKLEAQLSKLYDKHGKLSTPTGDFVSPGE